MQIEINEQKLTDLLTVAGEHAWDAAAAADAAEWAYKAAMKNGATAEATERAEDNGGAGAGAWRAQESGSEWSADARLLGKHERKAREAAAAAWKLYEQTGSSSVAAYASEALDSHRKVAELYAIVTAKAMTAKARARAHVVAMCAVYAWPMAKQIEAATDALEAAREAEEWQRRAEAITADISEAYKRHVFAVAAGATL